MANTEVRDIRAFLSAVVPLRGLCHCDNDAMAHGRDLIAIMAVEQRDDIDITLPLSLRDCRDVLEFLHRTEARDDADHVCWGGSVNKDSLVAKYGGDPGHGLFLLLEHLSDQLTVADLRGRASAIGCELVADGSPGEWSVRKVGAKDSQPDRLSINEAESFIAERERAGGRA